MRARPRLLKWAAPLALAAAWTWTMAAPARAGVAVIYDGAYQRNVELYSAKDHRYLSARDAGKIYKGQIYWYPLSGQVHLKLGPRPIRFSAGSKEVMLGNKAVLLQRPVLTRADQAYIPFEFFLSEDFARHMGIRTDFDAEAGVLRIGKDDDSDFLRYFSYPDKTRIVLEFDAPVPEPSSQRRGDRLEVFIPKAVAAGGKKIGIDDERVEEISLSQQKKGMLLSARLKDAAAEWKVSQFKDPERLVLDVFSASAPVAEKAPLAPEPEAGAEKNPQAPAPQRARRKIVIDPGHGGKDGGAQGLRRSVEKNINLLVGEQLAQLLRQEKAYDVILTRDSDVFVPLEDRSRMANEAGADLFISLHANYSRSHQVNGFEIYFLSEKASDPEAELVARFENESLKFENGRSGAPEDNIEALTILSELERMEFINQASELGGFIAREMSARIKIENRGLKQAAFYVLRGTRSPALLIEMGYISNSRDAALLSQAKVRKRIVDGIYAGVLRYAKRKGW